MENYGSVLIVSIIVTLLAYGAFPFLYAIMRTQPITTKRYKVMCYIVNFFVMLAFIAFSGRSSGSPYMLWTFVFCRVGINKLKEGHMLADSQDDASELNVQADNMSSAFTDYTYEEPVECSYPFYCTKCGKERTGWYSTCPDCGAKNSIVRK